VTLVVSWQSVWVVILALAMLCYVMALMGSAWCRWGDLASSFRSSNGDNVVVAVQLAEGAAEGMMRWEGDMHNLEVAWNRLCYGSMPPVSLQIALFMKK
jgi:hypothetical protein